MTTRCAPLRVAPPIPMQCATEPPPERNGPRNSSATPDLKALALQVLARNGLRNASAMAAPDPRNSRATDSPLERVFSERDSSVAVPRDIGTQRATLPPVARAVYDEIARHPQGIGDLKLKQVFWKRRVQGDELDAALASLLQAGLVRRTPADPYAFCVTEERDTAR